MSQVWPLDLRPTLKLLLLSLADSANDDGKCWPSIDAISEKCSTDRRSMFRQIAELEALGYIEREERRGHSSIYHVRLAHKGVTQTPPVVTESPVTETPLRGDAITTPPVTLLPPTRDTVTTQNHKEPSKNHQGTQRAVSLPASFGAAWSEPMRAWLAKNCKPPDVEQHLIYFVGYAKANGKKYVDWEQAFQNAIRGNWAKLGKSNGSNRNHGVRGEDERSAARRAILQPSGPVERDITGSAERVD